MAAHPVTLIDDYNPIGPVSARICEDHDLPPVSAPPGGVCYRCYASRRQIDGRTERVIDLGVWIEMEGKLLLCETCGIEIASVLGFVDPAKADDLRKANRTLGSENHQLKRKLAAAMKAVSDLSDTIQDKYGE